MREQVHNRQCPMKSLSTAHRHDAAARFAAWDLPNPYPTLKACYLHGCVRTYTMTQDVCAALLGLGELTGMSCVDIQIGRSARPTVSVMGVIFSAGEPMEGVKQKGWSNSRCGSVCTAVVKDTQGGRAISRYGLIKFFIARLVSTRWWSGYQHPHTLTITRWWYSCMMGMNVTICRFY